MDTDNNPNIEVIPSSDPEADYIDMNKPISTGNIYTSI